MRTKTTSGAPAPPSFPLFVLLLGFFIPQALHTHALKNTHHGAPIETGEDTLPLSEYGRSDSLRSAGSVPSDRLEQLRALSPAFDGASKYKAQVQWDQASALQLMDKGECVGVIWGKKEIVSSLKGMRNLLRNIANPRCWQSSFELAEGAKTKTWRLCATTGPEDHLYFSWVRRVDEVEGSCRWLRPTTAVDIKDVIECLSEVDPNKEVAVSGIVGSHDSCTACAVGEWQETPCDSWCEDGLKGLYRSILSHENVEHCKAGGDLNCDSCPPLWDVQSCNTDVSCATGLQLETHFCPTAGEHGQQARTWRVCQEQCASSFAGSNGKVSDLSTYYQADCVRFSFRNDTATCVLHPLHTCPPDASAPDPLWISGDVLSSLSGETSLVWSEWLQWSSCDKVDRSVGWKKRVRRVSQVRKWGYAGDNNPDVSAWIDVASCDNAQALNEADVNLARAPHHFEDWSSIKCVPECGTDRVKTRTRKIRQQPVPQEDGNFLPECAATELSAEALEQTQSCPGDVDCTRKCFFSDWAPWSECQCTDSTAGIGRRLRARLLVSGDEGECGPLEEAQKCEGVSCSPESSKTSLYAAAGGAGAVVLLLAAVIWYRASQNSAQPQQEYL